MKEIKRTKDKEGGKAGEDTVGKGNTDELKEMIKKSKQK